jgi:hypothetical protein
MAEFIISKEVTTDVPIIEVTITPDKPLPIGRQRFRLVVTDDRITSRNPTKWKSSSPTRMRRPPF